MPILTPSTRRTLLYGAVAEAAAFSPTDISGLQLWLDFSDISTLFQASDGTTPVTADGDVIGYAADKSGNGNHATQGTTGNKPTYQTGIQNSLSAMESDGADDYLSKAFTWNQPAHIFMVLKTKTLANFDVFFCGTAGTSNFVCGVGSPITTFYINAGKSLSNTLTTANDTSYILEALANDDNSLWDLNNGAFSKSGDANANNPSGLVLPARSDFAFSSAVYVMEVCAYAGDISSDADTLRSYLNTKWSVY